MAHLKKSHLTEFDHYILSLWPQETYIFSKPMRLSKAKNVSVGKTSQVTILTFLCYSSVVSSAPTILRPRVRIPSTP